MGGPRLRSLCVPGQTALTPLRPCCRYGKGRRGAIMGLWNAHTSVGNIGGSLAAAAALSAGWGWAFLAPGAALVAAAGLIWLLLAAEPEDAGLQPDGLSELQARRRASRRPLKALLRVAWQDPRALDAVSLLWLPLVCGLMRGAGRRAPAGRRRPLHSRPLLLRTTCSVRCEGLRLC